MACTLQRSDSSIWIWRTNLASFRIDFRCELLEVLLENGQLLGKIFNGFFVALIVGLFGCQFDLIRTILDVLAYVRQRELSYE